jgi:hypothetical protein
MARLGVKVIVFVQDKRHCQSVARTVAERLRAGEPTAATLPFTSLEREWLASAAEDLGGDAHVIRPSSAAAVHHSLLLPAERRASESVFTRADGVHVLVATPTLAQGMNLPAEAVIIAGDGRFDAAQGEQARLNAHELLNAAGRAGRAGHRAAGIVFVVPEGIVTTTAELAGVGGPWDGLRRDVFSKPDQCLVIGDPVELLLDRVETEAGSAVNDRTLRYFLTRLPVDEREQDPGMATARILGRSLAAYRARKRGERAAFQTRVEGALLLRRRIAQVSNERVQGLDRVVSTSGMPAQRVAQLERALRRHGLVASAGTADWIDWLFRWFGASSGRLTDMIRIPALEAAMSREEFAAVKRASTPEASDAALPTAVQAALPAIRRRLAMWMEGRPLVEIEGDLRPGPSLDAECRAARTFVTRAVHEFAYLMGIAAQVYRGHLDNWTSFADDAEEAPADMPTALGTLGACVREGVDSPEKLAVYTARHRRDPYTSRVSAHRAFAAIRNQLPPAGATEPFGDLHRRVEALLYPPRRP